MNKIEQKISFKSTIKLLNHKVCNCDIVANIRIVNGFIGSTEIVKDIINKNLVIFGLESNNIYLILELALDNIRQDLSKFNIDLCTISIEDSE